MATTSTTQIETGHGDMVHDAQLDYYGRRLATCSSDRTIKVWELDEAGEQQSEPSAVLSGHEGPVWQVAWAHPKFGTILASCSYDRRVIVWKEHNAGDWRKLHEFSEHTLSVNSMAWAPHEYGLALACASSDSSVSVLRCGSDGKWESSRIQAHQIGVNCVCWAPATAPKAFVDQSSQKAVPRRLASGGCDNLVKLWRYDENDAAWHCEEQLAHHKDWVRDVAFAPATGCGGDTLASCSQDGTVVIWTRSDSDSKWTSTPLPKFPDVVWRVSWSLSGAILAVSGGDNRVTLWKESADSTWQCVKSLDKTN